jgi:hypothetical protein
MENIETHIETRGHTECREGRIMPIGRLATEQGCRLPRDVVGVHLLPVVRPAMLPQPSQPAGNQFFKPPVINRVDEITTRIDSLFVGE